MSHGHPARPRRMSEQALAEFKDAVDIWFAKMDDEAKHEAVEYVGARQPARRRRDQAHKNLRTG